MKCAGIITAAGLSSRMGAFKPLLEINGLPMIVHTVLSMKNAGVSPICVVIGHRGNELLPVLEPLGVLTVENRNPAGSDMLTSVRLGLEQIRGSEAFFLLPADMPLISPNVFLDVRHTAEETGASYVIPTVGGRHAHPPLIGRGLYDRILNFSGQGGLRAALTDTEKVTVEAGDAAMNRDADRPEDFQLVVATAKARMGLSDACCRDLWDICGTPEHVRRHCVAVAELADAMAGDLIACGMGLDRLLCRSGGLLHDLMRVRHRHELAGADYLYELGYDRLAGIVVHHMTFDDLPVELNEETLVYLADKLVKEDRRVSPAERYAPARAKFPAETELGARVLRDMQAAEQLCGLFTEITGKRLYAAEESTC